MKATRIDGQAVNGNRTILAEVLPLDTPYSITFFPIYACNFKCNYCLHALNKEDRGHISDVVSMNFELYKKCIDDIATFPRKVKAIHFAGLGEPLLHKDIAKMVAYAVEKEVANVVDIVTNGALLTPQLSGELINAGLSTLRISTQGTDAQKYKQISDADIDFQEFIKNIEYFYKNRGNTHMYIKIIDIALDKGEEEKFFNTFGDICDSIAIEHLCPLVGDIDYKNINDDKEFKLTMNGNNATDSEVCPQPFYSMQIYPDGKYIPCCTAEEPIVVGDCTNKSVLEIWNSKELNSFRKLHLSKKKINNIICAKCQRYKYTMFAEEILDNYAERLLKLF